MNKIAIFTDDDTDGLVSAFMVKTIHENVLDEKVDIKVQTWSVFGLLPQDVEWIKTVNSDRVMILDIGSDMQVLSAVKNILETTSKSVTILDNHPPTEDYLTPEEYKNYIALLTELKAQQGRFYISSSTENCTAGITFSHLGEPKELARWAIVGLVGDVATETSEGGQLYGKLANEYPLLKGLLMSKNAGANYDWSVANFFAQLFHVPRRIIYDEAVPLVFDAMSALHNIDSWSWILHKVNKIRSETRKKKGNANLENLIESEFDIYPQSLKKLIYYTQLWHEKWKDALYDSTYLDYEKVGIAIISHQWNLGSALANVLNSMKGKPVFVINLIPDKNIIHISARSNGNIHVGKVLKQANNAGILVGGGIKQAGSGIAKTSNLDEIINTICSSVEGNT